MDFAQRLNQSPGKTFLHYTSLNIISMLGFSLYIFADTFFIANGVGQDGLVALNLVIPLYSVMNACALMVATGAATKYAICLGEGDQEGACRAFTLAFRLGLGLGIFFLLLGNLAAVPIVQWLGAEGEIIEMSSTYIRTLLTFSPAVFINHLLVYLIRNDGNPRLGMVAMLSGSVFNIIFDYIFIYPLAWGMFGAALATGFSPIMGLLVDSLHIIQKKNQFHWRKLGWTVHKIMKEIGSVLSVGGGAFVNECSSGIVILLFNFAILDLTGEVGVAAYGIVANLSLMMVAVYTGLGQGIQPLISYSYGARRPQIIHKVFRWGILFALCLGVFIYFCCFCFAEGITSVFNSEQDPVLATLTIHGMRLYFLAALVMGLNIVLSAFAAALSKGRPAFLISICRGIVLVVPIVLFLARFFGMDGVWLSIPLTELLTLCLGVFLTIGVLRQTGRELQEEK